ncbi:hypothetical protein ACKUU1_00975 [Mycobacterium seoulense]|uniref:hypothetical protein n=1 Tax=Mycobacterium seoulense TaxID=386911 RepID=UPI003CEABAFD
MSDSPSPPNGPDRPEDFDGLRTELAEFVDDFVPLSYDLWVRLEDHRSRWQLYGSGLPDGYEKLVSSDVIDLLGESLKGLAHARERMKQAILRADDLTRET